jgi:hypothetical protein
MPVGELDVEWLAKVRGDDRSQHLPDPRSHDRKATLEHRAVTERGEDLSLDREKAAARGEHLASRPIEPAHNRFQPLAPPRLGLKQRPRRQPRRQTLQARASGFKTPRHSARGEPFERAQPISGTPQTLDEGALR